jgi:hypothetical protein
VAEKAKTLLAKLRFVEWVSTIAELSRLDMAVAIRLVSLFNPRRGYAWPPLDQLAGELGATKRSVIRSIDRLEARGLFDVMRSTGRGHSNEYRPLFENMPDGDAYAETKKVTPMSPNPNDEKVTRTSPFNSALDSGERVTFRAQRVTSQARKGDVAVTPSDLTTGLDNRSIAIASPSGDALPPRCDSPNVGAHLARFESVVLRSILQQPRHDALRSLSAWSEWLDQIADEYSAHEGDPIGGRAYRLHDHVCGLIDDIEASG